MLSIRFVKKYVSNTTIYFHDESTKNVFRAFFKDNSLKTKIYKYKQKNILQN